MSGRLSDLDQQTLRALKQHGDDHTLARHVIYWLFFPSDEARRAALCEAISNGWRQHSKTLADAPGEDDSWILSVDANHDLTEEVLVERLDTINSIATKHGGDFDGWEAQIAVGERTERPRGLLHRLFKRR
ncbi:MAG: ribonuclease E inhibitor RraB [Phycisphaerales bacterium]|nr:ribonuclease E inhibitor RraB [Phycisphaerales bacterium]